MILKVGMYYDNDDALAKNKKLPTHEIFYDEFPVVTSAQLDIVNDVLKAEVDQFQLAIDKKYG